MRVKTADKYGRGSAAANGVGFVDLAPGDTFDGLERQLRARIAEVYVNRTLAISASIGSKRNANELAKHMARGEDEEVHKFAAKNIGALFERGQLGIRHFDKKAIRDDEPKPVMLRVFSRFEFSEAPFLATITLRTESAGNKLYAVEAVDVTKDAWPERTPRGETAPFLDPTSFVGSSIAYYVGDCNRTKPEFVSRDEPFSVVRTAELLAHVLKTNHQPLSTTHSALFSLDFQGTAVVTDDGRAVSYADLRTLCDNWHREIAPRSLVFLLVRNNLDSLVAYIACLNRGIVPLMLDAKIDPELLARFVATYRPTYVINCIVQSAECRVQSAECHEAAPSTSPSLHPSLALLITTSGSTGAPKLVRQSYTNIKANAESIAEYLKIDATERPITTLPMNYVYGLSIINSHLIRGATILLTNKTLMQREFWNFFTEQQATSFGGVPYTYEMLDKLMFFRRKLPSLRTMTQAGGKILPELHRKFAEYAKREGKNFVVMYGASEATSRMSYLPPERSLDKIGSMGIAIPGGRFELVGVDGGEVGCGEVGELVYEGPNVTLGYAECAADLSKGDERNGRLLTGDMAKRDTEGFYYIVGRKKRFLKIFGNRVNLDETERLIKTRFPGVELACGGVDDKMKIYIVRLFDCSDCSIEQRVRDFVAEKTHLNFAAFDVCWIDKIPKNESGKTLYKELPA